MSAIDDWQSVLYPIRRKILDALASSEVTFAVAVKINPEDPTVPSMMGPELSHEEEAALAAAIAVLEEA